MSDNENPSLWSHPDITNKADIPAHLYEYLKKGLTPIAYLEADGVFLTKSGLCVRESANLDQIGEALADHMTLSMVHYAAFQELQQELDEYEEMRLYSSVIVLKE